MGWDCVSAMGGVGTRGWGLYGTMRSERTPPVRWGGFVSPERMGASWGQKGMGDFVMLLRGWGFVGS